MGQKDNLNEETRVKHIIAEKFPELKNKSTQNQGTQRVPAKEIQNKDSKPQPNQNNENHRENPESTKIKEGNYIQKSILTMYSSSFK